MNFTVAIPKSIKVLDGKTQPSQSDVDTNHDLHSFDVVVTQQELDASADVAAFLEACRSGDEEAWPLTARMAEPPGPAPKHGALAFGGGRNRANMIFRAEPPDKNAPQPAKNFAPSYFVARPAAPRQVASPHAPDEPPVDLEHLPPGALMRCPYTRVNFTVPYPPVAFKS